MNPDTVGEPKPPDTLKLAPPEWLDTLRAHVMFWLGFVYLLLVAGLIHRATSSSVSEFELNVLYTGLLVLWPVFVVEGVWGVIRRDRSKPARPVVLRALVSAVMPPWRMAEADPRTGLVWIPRLGWQEPGKPLFKQLEKAFSGPMLLFAFLILPVLMLEYLQADRVKSDLILSLTLDLGIAVIWVAFATEFVFKASTHPKPFQFAKERWLDVAIVVLPMLEFFLTKWADAAPLARLLKTGRALNPEQLARMQRLYRLQGLATKAWHALLLIEGVARLFGQTPKKRLVKLERRIAEMEEELAELQREANAVRALVTTTKVGDEIIVNQNQPRAETGGGTMEPSGEVLKANRRPSVP